VADLHLLQEGDVFVVRKYLQEASFLSCPAIYAPEQAAPLELTRLLLITAV
jgi:hypothetical protein